MKSFKRQIIWNLILIFTMLSIFSGCDLPATFQKDKDDTMSKTDQQACRLLSRPLSHTDTLINGNDTSFSTSNLYVPVVAAYLTGSFLDYWLNASDSLIDILYDTLLSDTTLLILNPGLEDTCYTFFEKGTEPSKTLFFISWDLNEDNIDAYLKIEIFASTGQKIQWQSDGLTQESVAGCTQVITVSGVDQTVPKIRARYVFQLPQGKYLVRFYISEPATVANFRVVIL